MKLSEDRCDPRRPAPDAVAAASAETHWVGLPPAGAAAPCRRLRLPRDPPGACRGALAWDAGRKSVLIAGDPVTGRSASGPERTGGKRGVVARVPACCSREALMEQQVEHDMNVAAVVRRARLRRLDTHGVPWPQPRRRRALLLGDGYRETGAGGVQNADRSWLGRRPVPARDRLTRGLLHDRAVGDGGPAGDAARGRSILATAVWTTIDCCVRSWMSRLSAPLLSWTPVLDDQRTIVALASLDASALAAPPICCVVIAIAEPSWPTYTTCIAV